MAQYITTYSKVHFYPLCPNKEDIKIEDIAHSLSLLCRANGHFPEFYSVAQHCIACCEEAKARKYSTRMVLACLLHDASEAYMSDIPRPVKQDLEDFNRDEEQLLSTIMEHFLGEDLSKDEWELIADVDDTLLFHEFRHYMGEELKKPNQPLCSNPEFTFWPFREVEKEYLQLFHECIAQIQQMETRKLY